MTATLKTTIIQEPSSATANMTLDTSGGVNFGAASTVATVPIVTTTGSQTLTNKTLASPTINTPTMGGSVLTLGTAVSASGTSVPFTGIPSWAKRITVLCDSVSTTGTSRVLLQVGSGSYTTSGYSSSTANIFGTNTTAFASSTAGFIHEGATTGSTRNGAFVLMNITGNTWICTGVFGDSTTAVITTGGRVSLGGVLTQLRLTTVNGTDTFDAGTVNIMYE